MSHETDQHWRLTPYRSLSHRATKAVLGGTAAVSAVMAGALIVNGLWPVALFTVIPPLGLAFGLAANNRSGHEWQDIKLTRTGIVITDYKPGWDAPRETRIPPGWVRVETVTEGTGDPDAPPRCNAIILRTRGRGYEIGAFLPPIEKTAFAAELRTALARWDAPLSYNAPDNGPHP